MNGPWPLRLLADDPPDVAQAQAAIDGVAPPDGQDGDKAGGEEILLDCDALAKGKAYSQVSAAAVNAGPGRLIHPTVGTYDYERPDRKSVV
mgnify:CR=1 FL=1